MKYYMIIARILQFYTYTSLRDDNTRREWNKAYIGVEPGGGEVPRAELLRGGEVPPSPEDLVILTM